VRLVVDTKVFVSAALNELSWPAAVVRWLDKFGGLLKSTVTEAQMFEVLQRPYFASKLPSSYVDNVRRIVSQAEMVTIIKSNCVVYDADELEARYVPIERDGSVKVRNANDDLTDAKRIGGVRQTVPPDRLPALRQDQAIRTE
jgi:hypothetical protein